MATAALNALRTIQHALAAPRVEQVPPGWRTTQQWADEWGLSRPHANRIIRGALKAGLMEYRSFCIENGLVTRPEPHYRMKGKQ